jgi:lipopolysaccharide/colanic/teichoic acid biosynthesis glycosyltransferase
MGKRLIDLVGSLCGLIVLSPFFAVLAIWIKFDSSGPVFFRQERVGQHGRCFRIFKFRTMIQDITGRAMQITVGHDPRITSSGLVLRKTKLDELPQLINVLVGDMSLVGPRPEVPRYVECYPAELRQLVLSVRPGITDNASIEFANESDLLADAVDPELMYTNEILPRKLKLYANYVREHSILGDLSIIMRTVARIAFR